MIDVKDIDAIIGADVVGRSNDRIGRVSQVYIDSEDQHPSWVSVRTGFFGRSETLIPIDDARWESSTLFVQVDRAKVREAPHVDPDQELSVEEQTALYRYYGKDRVETVDAEPASAEAEGAPEVPAAETETATLDAEPATDAAAAESDVVGEPEADAADDAREAADAPWIDSESVASSGPAAEVLPEEGDEPVRTEDVAPQPAVQQDVAQQDALPEESVQQDAVPEESVHEDVVRDAEPADADPEEAAQMTDAADAEGVDDGAGAPVAAAADVPGVDATDPSPEANEAAARPRRSNYVQPAESEPAAAPEAEAASAPADAAPAPAEPGDAPEVITRYEERLRIATERVPASRIRLVKRIVTEHHTVSVPVSHEELHVEREPIGEDEIASWEGPLAELQEEEREIVLMAERPVVSTHTAPIERIRIVREVVSGTHDVEADLRHEQFDVDRGDNA